MTFNNDVFEKNLKERIEKEIPEIELLELSEEDQQIIYKFPNDTDLDEIYACDYKIWPGTEDSVLATFEYLQTCILLLHEDMTTQFAYCNVCLCQYCESQNTPACTETESYSHCNLCEEGTHTGSCVGFKPCDDFSEYCGISEEEVRDIQSGKIEDFNFIDEYRENLKA